MESGNTSPSNEFANGEVAFNKNAVNDSIPSNGPLSKCCQTVENGPAAAAQSGMLLF